MTRDGLVCCTIGASRVTDRVPFVFWLVGCVCVCSCVFFVGTCCVFWGGIILDDLMLLLLFACFCRHIYYIYAAFP